MSTQVRERPMVTKVHVSVCDRAGCKSEAVRGANGWFTVYPRGDGAPITAHADCVDLCSAECLASWVAARMRTRGD